MIMISLVTILNPVFATALFALVGMEIVVYVDLMTFGTAFVALRFFVEIPPVSEEGEREEPFLKTAKAGLKYLRGNPLILALILFLAGVNLVASAFDAVLPAYVIPRENGGEKILGLVSSCAGIAMLFGSLAVTLLPAPKNRIRVIYVTMLISLNVENFILAFTRHPVLWCIGQVAGWALVPVMSANLDVVLRTSITAKMQGWVYSCRNTLQFFTIPVGFFFGGFAVDEICEPVMEGAAPGGLLAAWFGSGKGSGAAMMMFILGVMGVVVCLHFWKILRKYQDDGEMEVQAGCP